MVLYVCKWNIRSEKRAEYPKWAEKVTRRCMEEPDIEQFRAYRPVTGSHEVVATYEFSDLNSFSAWIVKEETQQMAGEARTYCEDMTCELWGPSPVASKIIHSA